jgi:hypothetical protein
MFEDLLNNENLKYIVAIIVIFVLFMCFRNQESFSLDLDCDNTTCDKRFCESERCHRRGHCDCGGDHCVSCSGEEDCMMNAN